MRFELVGDRTQLRLFADGNGNGVLQRDIDRGIDAPVTPPAWLDDQARDLSLRIIQLSPKMDELAAAGPAWDIIQSLVEVAVDQYRNALRAWSTQDLDLATRLVEEPPRLGSFHERLLAELRQLEGADAISTAVDIVIAAQAADRIADHAAIIGARLRYLITGEPKHLVAEVR